MKVYFITFHNMAKNKKKHVFSKPIVKRVGIWILLGIIFGFLCSFLAWKWDSTLLANPDYWWSALMWNIVFNRFIMWFIIAILWLITIHPIFWFRMYPALRWAMAWWIISIDISFWPFIMWYENAWTIAIYTILAWAIYGMIIDLIASKFAWEWEELFKSIK